MKLNILASAVLGLAIVAISYAFKTGQLEFSVRSERTSYSLGELIPLEFEVKNVTNQDLIILNGLRPFDGYLTVWISRDGKTFEKYDHTKWGIADSSRITTLKPNESTINRASVFWNSKPKFSKSVPSDIVERTSSGRILTDYAFPEVGTYYLKASYSIFLAGQTEGVRIESSPIKINITEPTGADLEVWNRIKENGDFAYFIQEGDLPIASYKKNKRDQLRDDIVAIINEFPDSSIVTQMRLSLRKFNEFEEKVRLATERLKPPE